MENPVLKVAELSLLNTDLDEVTKKELKGPNGEYVERLGKIRRGPLLGGTNISSPSAVVLDHRHRTHIEVMSGFHMDVPVVETPEGTLLIFPLRTIGLTGDFRPIIDKPGKPGCYTVAHAPFSLNPSRGDIYSPANLKVDLLFSVDSDDLVTLNGIDTPTAEEYELFDSIVKEFEGLSAGIETNP